MNARHRRGFTMLETLMVMSIIGILAAIMFANLTNTKRKAEVRDAAQQIAADLRAARGHAQRYAESATVTITSGSPTYTVQWASNPLASPSRTLQNKIVLKPTSGSAAAVTYNAPFGEQSATGTVWEVASPVSTIAPMYVKVVGITGKVVVSATNN